MFVVQQLFVKAVQNAKVRGEPIPTMPFVTSFVSATPKHEGEDSSHYFGANIAEAEVDSFARPSVPVLTATTTITSTADLAMVVKERIVEPSLFVAESTSTGGSDPAMAGLTDLIGSDFLVGCIRTVINPNFDLQKTYIPLWNVTNGFCHDIVGVFHEMVDEFGPSKFFASVCIMKHNQLFTKFNVGDARQMSLSAEVRMRVEYNIREKRRLKSVVEEKDQLLKARDEEVRGEPIPTMPFVTSFVYATPKREGEGHTDSITGLNLRTISAP
nr:hypothetical protein [Tanacetum cinerariifolium]